MALTTEQKEALLKSMMSHWSRIWERVDVSQQGAMEAITATDDWIEANQSDYNLALPASPRSLLSATQKTLLFCAVAMVRADPEFAKIIFGE